MNKNQVKDMSIYILIDTADDSGNDDGVMAREMFTYQQSEKRNDRFRKKGSTARWVLANPPKSAGITHID